MFRKALLLSLVLFGSVFSITKLCFADAASDLSQAESFVKGGQFTRAEQICLSIVQSNPGSDAALKAQGKLAAIYIMTQRMSLADAEVDKLMGSFKKNAELPAVLYGMVGRFKTARDFQRAQNLSQRICQEFPASEQAQRIQLDLGKEQAFSLIADGKFQQAEEAVNNMVSAASRNPAMPPTLFKIAREFKEAGRYDETGRVYQRIAMNYPNSEFAGKARMGVDKLRIWNLIKAGDVAGMQSALDKLISDYSSEDDLPHTVHGVALKLEENGYYEQAKSLYQRVKKDYPNEDVAEMATVDVKLCGIRAMVGKTSYSTVKTELDKLMSDFSNNKELPKAVWRVALEYFQQAMRLDKQGSAEQAKELYGNAATVWQIVINQLPRSSATPEACNYAAICYEKLGEYEKANALYQSVIDNYPGYGLRWNMMFKVGYNYEQMKNARKIPAAQADAQTKAMYERLLMEYPDCMASKHARKWLRR